MEWDLSVLYKGFDDPAFHEDMAALAGRVQNGLDAINALAHGADDAAGLADGLVRVTDAANLLTKVSSFVSLTLATDATNADALKLQERMAELNMQFEQLNSAYTRFVGGAPELEGAIASTPILAEHAFVLREMKKMAAHLLPEALEPTVRKLQITGGYAWENLRNMLDGTMLVAMTENGETVRRPLSAVRGLAYDADPAARKAAYEAELAAYPSIEIPMAACLNGIKGETLTTAALRGYASPLDQSLDSARMDRQTLEALWEAVRLALPDFRRYLRKKARLLGREGGLPFYDLFAPMGGSGRTYTLDEAREILINVLGGFSGRMEAFIRRAFDEKWIDAYPKPGKSGGAFCAGIHPLKISRILLNHDGSLSSVGTLAHELGHAYHNEVMGNQSVLNAQYPMPLAETASIFNETLFAAAAIKNAEGGERLALLDLLLTEATQTVVDIYSRFLFETAVFEKRRDQNLTPGELCATMLEAQEQAYGDGLSDARHPYMWACKCHYYMNDFDFYNYPYAFGLLFGRGIYAQYLERGTSFVPTYDALLSAAGRGDVATVAASVGIDVRSTDFWRASLKTIIRQIDEYEKIVDH